MANEYLIGIDIGTSESKGALTTTEGKIVAVASCRHDLEIPRAGWAEHDAEYIWWRELCLISKRLLEMSRINPGHILALACSTIGPCVLPVDRNGNPLRKAILYGIDTRAVEEIRELNERIGPEEIFAKCGNDLSAQAVGPKILWLRKQEPEVYQRSSRFVGGTSYLVWKLTGRWVIDHYSASTFLPLYDLHRQEWSSELAEGIVDLEALPPVAWSTQVAGTISPSASSETGLPAGLPVVTGTIDAAAEAVSVGVVSPGRMMLMYGSTLFMIQVVPQRLSDLRVWSAPFLFPDTHAVMAGMATSGSLTTWFRDHFARELLLNDSETDAFARLAEEAAGVPAGSSGLTVLPYFSGERTPINDPEAKGIFFGLTLAHSRGHLYRAILESTGYGIRHHLEVFRELNSPATSLHAVGGGTKNALWLQIVSDICNISQSVFRISVGACYGDAFLAGMGAGVFSSAREVEGWLQPDRTVEPALGAATAYDRAYGIYRKLYERTRDLMRGTG